MCSPVDSARVQGCHLWTAAAAAQQLLPWLLSIVCAAAVAAAAAAAPDFDYSQTISSAPLVVPGHVHRGFYNIAKAIWPGIRTALRELTVGQGIRHAWLTGHSLGGGVGTLISYAAQVCMSPSSSALREEACLVRPGCRLLRAWRLVQPPVSALCTRSPDGMQMCPQCVAA